MNTKRMNTKRMNTAAGVILAAQESQQTALEIAASLESARLLQSPETADEQAELLRQRNAFQDQRNAVFATNTELLSRVERADLERLQAENENRTLTRRVAELEAELRIGAPWKCSVCGKDNKRDVCAICETNHPDAEDPCRPCGCPKRFDRHADGCPLHQTDVLERDLKIAVEHLADEGAEAALAATILGPDEDGAL